MRTFSLKFVLFSLFLLTAPAVFAQPDDDSFKSGDGGFKINLPKDFTSVKDYSNSNKFVLSEGRMYIWSGLQAYNYSVVYNKVRRTDGKPMTALEKSQFLKGFRDGMLKS